MPYTLRTGGLVACSVIFGGCCAVGVDLYTMFAWWLDAGIGLAIAGTGVSLVPRIPSRAMRHQMEIVALRQQLRNAHTRLRAWADALNTGDSPKTPKLDARFPQHPAASKHSRFAFSSKPSAAPEAPLTQREMLLRAISAASQDLLTIPGARGPNKIASVLLSLADRLPQLDEVLNTHPDRLHLLRDMGDRHLPRALALISGYIDAKSNDDHSPEATAALTEVEATICALPALFDRQIEAMRQDDLRALVAASQSLQQLALMQGVEVLDRAQTDTTPVPAVVPSPSHAPAESKIPDIFHT